MDPWRFRMGFFWILSGLAGVFLGLGCGAGEGTLDSPAPRAGQPSEISLPMEAPSLGWKIPVSERGLYRISFEALKEAGLPVATLDAIRFRLSLRSPEGVVEVPLRVQGIQDGHLAPGGFLEFYGEPITRAESVFRYTQTRVYWLEVLPAGEGARIQPRSFQDRKGIPDQTTYTARLHLEEDTFYWQNLPDPDPSDDRAPDRWFWGGHLAPGASLRDLAFHLPDSLQEGQVLIRIRVQGSSGVDHQVGVLLGLPGEDPLPLGSRTWSGIQPLDWDLVLNQALSGPPSPGTYSIRIENLSENVLSRFLVDWVEVSYPSALVPDPDGVLIFQALPGASQGLVRIHLRGFSESPLVLDITDAPATVYQMPVVASSGEWIFVGEAAHWYVALDPGKAHKVSLIAPAGPDLRAEAVGGASYLLITYDDPQFLEALDPLVRLRQAQGLQVLVARIQAVFDQFGGGMPIPDAIRAYLHHAYTAYRPRPKYVLLVGDGTIDYKDNLGWGLSGVKNSVPSYLYDFGASGQVALREVPSDTWFADVVPEDLDEDGQPDGLPEMAIGRIPAKNAFEVDWVVDKITAYEAGGHVTGPPLFVAESPYEADSVSLLARFFPGDLSARILNRSEYATISEARQALFDALNQSPWLINYLGHGAVVSWGRDEWFRSRGFDTPSGRIYGVDDLDFTGNFALVVALNCLNGYFVLPDDGILDPETGEVAPPSLAEALLLTPGKGAIAVVADSAYGFPSEYQIFAQLFYDRVLQQGLPVGEALRLALQEAVRGGGGTFKPLSRDLVATILLFGDPALKIQRPQ